jgi:hypothetical protein
VTRFEIKLRARDLLREAIGTPSWGDDLGADSELDHVVSELCRRKRIWFGSLLLPVSAGQRVVSLVNVLQLDGAAIGDRCLRVVGEVKATRFYPGWRQSGSGSPDLLVDTGRTAFLSPVPSSALTLEVFGYLTPAGLWPRDEDECPVPGWAHEVAALGLAAYRASLFVTDEEMRLRSRDLMARYERESRSLESEAARAYYQARGSSGRDGHGYA